MMPMASSRHLQGCLVRKAWEFRVFSLLGRAGHTPEYKQVQSHEKTLASVAGAFPNDMGLETMVTPDFPD